MNSNYVVSYDLAVKLKELGLKETLWLYDDTGINDCPGALNERNSYFKAWGDRWNPAPITDELLEMLPKNIIKNKLEGYMSIFPVETEEGYIYCVEYMTIYDRTLKEFEDEKLVNALAKMLIYLIRNEHVKL